MNIDSFILVGGRSSRMGRDKASLRLGGVTLVERIAATIESAFPGNRETLVAAGDNQFSTIFALQLGYPFVLDVYKNRGAYGGVHAALANARDEWALILASDLPLITAELLGRLVSFIADGIDAVVPIAPDDRIQPLCALYRVKPCLKIAEEPLVRNRPTPPVRSIAEQVATRYVQFQELSNLPGAVSFFSNVNTPADAEAASAQIASRPQGNDLY